MSTIKNSNVEVSDTDIKEYKLWVSDGDIDPNLRSRFDSDEDYDRFMEIFILNEYPDELKDVKTFSGISLPNLDTNTYGVGNLIGTISYSLMYTRLFRYSSITEYTTYIMMKEYYDKVGEQLDELAEMILMDRYIVMFNNEVFPKGSPSEYLSRVSEYIINSINAILSTSLDYHASSIKAKSDALVASIDSMVFRLRKFSSEDELQSTIPTGGVESQDFNPDPRLDPVKVQPVNNPLISNNVI